MAFHLKGMILWWFYVAGNNDFLVVWLSSIMLPWKFSNTWTADSWLCIVKFSETPQFSMVGITECVRGQFVKIWNYSWDGRAIAEDVRSWSHWLHHELVLRSRSTRATRSNERRGQLGDMSPSYVGDPGFKSWPEDWPSWQILCGVIQSLLAISGVVRWTISIHDSFRITSHSLFTSYLIFRHYGTWWTDSVVKA